jgi:hypothetical protein
VSFFLSSQPPGTLIGLIVVLPTALAIVSQALIHRWVGVDKLANNNEIGGFKFATVGVIYAVLLAFAVIAVWDKFNQGEIAVEQEASASSALFQYIEGKEPAASAVHAALVNYPTLAIEKEWPVMGKESESQDVTQALNATYEAALALNQTDTRTTADMTEIFAQLDPVTTARRTRLHLATGLVPSVIWIALFAGAALTVGFTLFFGSKNLPGQLSMTAILSVLVTLGLVVIVTIDHPFTGPIHIQPDPLDKVLAEHQHG